MARKNGQGKWYKLCFVPSSSDSSDDSDTESVVILPTTWEESSPQSPPYRSPSTEPQINWLDPPPPPLFFIPSSQSAPEHVINWRDPIPPPPPPPRPQQFLQDWAAEFDIESQQQPGIHQPPIPRNVVSLDHEQLASLSQNDQEWPEDYFLAQTSTWEELSPPHTPLQFFSPLRPLSPPDSPPSPGYRINWADPPPPPPPELQRIQAWRVSVDQFPCIRRVRITELDQRDKLSHCPICMEEFKIGEEAYQLPCNHAYRSECIIRWLRNRNTCPVCRLQLDG